jgi:uncharacterized protein YdeI (YjbR/CyaY-like superfamily)
VTRPASGDYEELHFRDRSAFRTWLAAHHPSSPGIWLVYHKDSSATKSITYDEAVEEALCFGWIDSRVKAIDDERYRQKFTPRRPGSTWSRTNKERVARLIASRRMTQAGLEVIEAAERDGSWTMLDTVEALEEPDDLAAALDAVPEARRFFDQLVPSRKKPTLWWVVSAKRPATRERRIAMVVARAAEGRTVAEA